MTEIDEKQITAKAEAYAEKKLVHFRPFIASYRQAIINAYIDAFIEGKLRNNDKMEPFISADKIIKE